LALMVFAPASPAPSANAKLARPVELFGFALAFAYAVYLVSSFIQGSWLIAADGAGLPADFVNVWAAGHLAITGHAASAYDGPTHKAIEVSAVGHPFDGYYGWHYPPTFLFVAMPLSLLPYAVACVVWTFGTFPAYLIAIRRIIGARIGYLLAAAFPAVLANFIVGQNGFLSAALIGGTLLLLDRRPVAAGVLLGLLTYKPHLGLLFPIALIASGRWRVFVTAAIVATAIAGASWLAFGCAAWQAFVAGIGHASQAFLSQDHADWAKLQTVFGLARTLGGSEALAWTLQGGLALIAATLIAALWHSHRTDEVKAAALATAALLATPYLYTYDLVVLAVPLAFLFRLGLAQGFLPYEDIGIGLACLLVLIFPFVKAPIGFFALLAVAGLIARRAMRDESHGTRLASAAQGS
jgi:arabinofuranan 3-O-arabinosyltransferase